jgi:hypothetical protein
LKNINQGYVLYLTLIGKPSIGKTTAMSMVWDAVNDVQVATLTKEEDSKLINSKSTKTLSFNRILLEF